MGVGGAGGVCYTDYGCAAFHLTFLMNIAVVSYHVVLRAPIDVFM